MYDPVGNRLTEERPTGTTSYAYDARDRLLSAGSVSYTDDQNGNELSAGTRTFAYDLANRLKQTTQASTTTTYLYDGDGLRAQASTGQQANRTTTFLWDVNGGLPQIAQESDGNGNPLRRYTYGVRRISQTAGNSSSYFLYDGLGSSVNLTSQSGQTQWTWSYEPFGQVRTETKASGSQPDVFLKFTGEYQDPTGLYHLRARQYDPQLGRFLTRDPADQTVNEAVISAYAYVANRPTVMVDPSGETFRPSWRGLKSARLATSREDESSSAADPTDRRYGNCGVSWLYAFSSRLRPGILTVAMGFQLYRRAFRHSWKATVLGPAFSYSNGGSGFGPWSGRFDRSFAVRVPSGKFRVFGDLWALTILGPCASGPLVDTETVG
jgi:RHS repeat-associated protein